MQIRIHDADLDDEHQRAELVAMLDAFARGEDDRGTPLTNDVKANLCDGLRTHPATNVVVASTEEGMIGVAVCVLGFSTFAARPLLNIHDLMVAPAHRGRGVGRALIAEVERRARALGCCKLTLEVASTNSRARKLYEEIGFGPWNEPTWFISKAL